MKKYSSKSPYASTKVTGSYLGPMQDRTIPKYGDDTVFTINKTYEFRPDLLAHDLYGDSKLWWVFAQRNPNALVNPLLDFAEGTTIRVPKLDTLKKVLGF